MTEKNTENNEKPDSIQTGSDKDTEKKVTENKPVPVFRVVTIIILTAVIVGEIFLYNRYQDAGQHAQLQTGQLESLNRQMQDRLQSLEDKQNQSTAQLKSLIDSIADIQHPQPAGYIDSALSEVEYLLVLASHHLLLEKDTGTALTAMQSALKRLESLNSEDLLPVREQLEADINKLKTVELVDISGLSIYLADLTERVNALPLQDSIVSGSNHGQKNTAAHTGSVSDWHDFFKNIWQELKTLVVIKKTGAARQELLLPDQEYFLIQNLRVELASARLSALRRDNENFHISVNTILEWLQQYYDVTSNDVKNILDTLVKMSEIRLDPDLPEINSSLETLRAYIRNRESAAMLVDKNNMAAAS